MSENEHGVSHVTPAGGNVFADLGVPEPEAELAKARLAQVVRTFLQEKGVSQRKAAELIGAKQPDVSAIVNGRLDGISLARLISIVEHLGYRVRVTVEEPEHQARLSA